MKQDSNRKMNTGWKSTNERTFVVRKFDFGKFLQRPKQFTLRVFSFFSWSVVEGYFGNTPKKTRMLLQKLFWNRFFVLNYKVIESFFSSALVASQWLGLFLQFIGVAMVTAVAFIAVLEHHFSTVDPGECFSLCTCTGSLPCRSLSHSFYEIPAESYNVLQWEGGVLQACRQSFNRG